MLDNISTIFMMHPIIEPSLLLSLLQYNHKFVVARRDVSYDYYRSNMVVSPLGQPFRVCYNGAQYDVQVKCHWIGLIVLSRFIDDATKDSKSPNSGLHTTFTLIKCS